MQTNFSGAVNSVAGFLTGGSNWGVQGGSFRSGVYYGPLPTGIEGATAFTNGDLRGSGVWVGRPTRFDRIAINVTVVGVDAGALTRLGIYSDDGRGAPGALLLDAGTVATGSAAGVGAKEIAIALTLPVGLYWLMMASQNLTGAGPTIEATSFCAIPDIGLSAPSPSIATGWTQAGVTGALPAVATPVRTATSIPLVFLRAA